MVQYALMQKFLLFGPMLETLLLMHHTFSCETLQTEMVIFSRFSAAGLAREGGSRLNRRFCCLPPLPSAPPYWLPSPSTIKSNKKLTSSRSIGFAVVKKGGAPESSVKRSPSSKTKSILYKFHGQPSPWWNWSLIHRSVFWARTDRVDFLSNFLTSFLTVARNILAVPPPHLFRRAKLRKSRDDSILAADRRNWLENCAITFSLEFFFEATVRYEVNWYEINSEAFEGYHCPTACKSKGHGPLFTHPLWEWRRAKSFRRSRRLSFFVEEEIDSANNPADNAITGALHWVGSEERPIFVCILHEIDLWMDLRHFQ